MLSLAGGACGSGDDDDGAVRTDGPEEPAAVLSPPDLDRLERFYNQRVSWKRCFEPEDLEQMAEDGMPPEATGEEVAKVECTTVEVPLSYDDPRGETIELAVNRIPAADQDNRIGSLLTNPGGPGESGWKLVALSGGIFTEDLKSRYDIVGFDPRGIGQSAPLECVTTEDVEEHASRRSPPEGNDERAQAREEQRQLIQGCERRAGDVIAHVGTENVARDMDVIRAALGDDKMHYLGFSYGTFLGQVYAEQFPDTVGRMALDSAADPKVWPNYESQIEQFAAMERELDEFVRWCVDGGECPLGDTTEDARRGLRELVDGLAAEPLAHPGSADHPVTDIDLRAAMNSALYSPENWPGVRELLAAAVAGDGAAVHEVVHKDETEGGGGEDPAADINEAVPFSAVTCLVSDGNEQTLQRTREFRNRAADVSPFFGPFAAMQLDCSDWPARPTILNHPIEAKGTPPILVVNNTRDNATPIQWARAVVRQLDNAVLVENDADGHIVYGKGPCTNAIVDHYLLDGTVPPDGTTCADAGMPPNQPDMLPG